MAVRLEKYNPQTHNQEALANLIYQSDAQMNALTYGKNALDVIGKLLTIPESYFVPEFMRCALVDDELVGVVVTFPASRLEEVDQVAGRGFMQAMGFLSFFSRMPLYLKMDKMLGGEMDEDGLYLHTLCVDENFRGKGIGSEIMEKITEKNSKLYLYVNMKNEGAIRFYQRNGFKEKYLGKMTHKGEEYGEYLMERK